MAKRDIIVLGGSAGAVEALMRLVAELPPSLPASIFVVVHFPEGHDTALPHILSRSGPLPALLAEHGAPIEPGHIYVARPGFHLLLDEERIRVRLGPRENRARPSIDVLFRSAAVTHGSRTIGAILSGTLDDGKAGLEAIRRAGGKTLVQHPVDALFPDLPFNTLKTVKADHAVPIADMAGLLETLTFEDVPESVSIPEDLAKEVYMVGDSDHKMELVGHLGELSPFKCPDCGGSLWKVRDTAMVRFRCHLGHAMASESLAAGMDENTERALWEAMELIKEKTRLMEMLAEKAKADDAELAGIYTAQVRRGRERTEMVEKLIQALRS